ncbi:hypothetical protein MPOCJGCO_2720 [Methylobacterium trifolii]|uniref:LigA n=1 Tax=Methylobacterium trifolii TaxID=1003092 RepID=A0ABQ4U1G2_9HYPH|nr:hypothetical protein MPOCJGCO_2720 [Methylobacterium trifolii]
MHAPQAQGDRDQHGGDGEGAPRRGERCRIDGLGRHRPGTAPAPEGGAGGDGRQDHGECQGRRPRIGEAGLGAGDAGAADAGLGGDAGALQSPRPVGAHRRHPAHEVGQGALGRGARAAPQVLAGAGALQDEGAGERHGEQPHRRRRDQAGGGQRREGQGLEDRGQRHRGHEQPDPEQPVDAGQRLPDEAGEAARLVAGAGRRVEDGTGRGLAQGPDRAVLGGEARACDDPAQSRQGHGGEGEAEEGGAFEVERCQGPARCEDELALRGRQRHGEAQEGQAGGLVPRQRADEVAQAQERQGAERAAEPDRRGHRSHVPAARGPPGQAEGIRFHGRSDRPGRGRASTAWNPADTGMGRRACPAHRASGVRRKGWQRTPPTGRARHPPHRGVRNPAQGGAERRRPPGEVRCRMHEGAAPTRDCEGAADPLNSRLPRRAAPVSRTSEWTSRSGLPSVPPPPAAGVP